MAIIEMSIFWDEWGVVYGNNTADNWYDAFNGLVMNDDFVCANATDFFNWNDISRYDFFRAYSDDENTIDSEYEFYQNTSDERIFDFYTFWKYAAEYLTPIPTIVDYVIGMDGDNNLIPYSNDGGVNFTNSGITIPSVLPTKSLVQLRSKTNDGENIYFGSSTDGATSRLYKWSSASNEMTILSTFTGTRSFNSVQYVNPNLFYAVPSQQTTNNLLKSTNGGVTFTASTLSPTFTPNKIVWANQGAGGKVIMGGNGTTQRFLYSTNSAHTTWSLCNTHTSIATELNSLYYFDNVGKYIALFKNSTNTQDVLISSNGITWTKPFTSTGNTLNLVCGAYDAETNTFMALSDGTSTGVISTDGFTTFQNITQPNKPFVDMTCIQGTNGLTRFIGVVSTSAQRYGVYYTDDFGTTWNQVDFSSAFKAIDTLTIQ